MNKDWEKNLPETLRTYLQKLREENTPEATEILNATLWRLESMISSGDDDSKRAEFEKLMKEVEEKLGRKNINLDVGKTSSERVQAEAASRIPEVPQPRQLAQLIGQYVKGQDWARRTVAIGVYQHYQRQRDPKIGGKSNILLAGPTGCGKTEIARSLGRVLGVPVHIADATGLTASGYVGKDTDSILLGLLQACNFDRELAETGIIFIDEIDKKAKKTSSTGGPDVGGESVQQALLKMIEGDVVEVEQTIPGMGKKSYTIDTSKILFIVGGAFVGLEEKIAARLNKGKNGYGLSAGNGDINTRVEAGVNLLSELTPEDFKSFGIIPELIGRLPVIAALHALSEEHMLEIMKETHTDVNIIHEYQRLFKSFDVDLEFEDEALRKIATYAVKQAQVGARGLRGSVSRLLEDASFDLPGSDVKSFTVTAELAVKKLNIQVK